jgi:hypothetical protein
MNTSGLRNTLFLFGCIGVRLCIAYVASRLEGRRMQIAGTLALLPVLGWAYIMLVKRRDTGPEVFGGRIWWQHLRIYHALLWTCFAYMAINRYPNAYIPLLLDTSLGLLAFIYKRYLASD